MDSPIVVVSKKSGDIRICVDLRRPNEAIIPDKYPLPNIEELLSELNGAKVFSKIDLKSAYHQVDLHEDSRPLTTFITHDGLYRYKRVCFGLASAPSCFQKMMSMLLGDIHGVQCFLDDIIVYGKDKAEHDKTLHAVLTKLTDYNVTLNDKCIFEVPSIQVLGHVIDSKGMHPNPDLSLNIWTNYIHLLD